MAQPAVDTITSAEINRFFSTVYGHLPVASTEKRFTTYSLPGAGISLVTDPYGGAHIKVTRLPTDLSTVKEAIGQLAQAYRANQAFDSLWIDMPFPATLSTFGAISPMELAAGNTGKSDIIYDYKEKMLKGWLWLNSEKECSIPAGATHNIGATALIVDSAAKTVLLVENVRRRGSWNLPGGSFEPAKDKLPSDTAIREAQEESGLILPKEILPKPILMSQMQFPQNQFAPAINQTWAYFIEGISKEVLHPPAGEIIRAEWFDIGKILESQDKLDGLDIGPEIKGSVVAACNQLGFREIMNKGWMIVHAPTV